MLSALLGELPWDKCSFGWVLFTHTAPTCTSKIALAVFYHVHVTHTYVPTEPGVVTSCQSSSCFLFWAAFWGEHSSPPSSLMETSRIWWKVSREVRTQVYSMCMVCSASKEGHMEVLAAVFRRLTASCVVCHFPLGSQLPQQVGITASPSTNVLAVLVYETQCCWQFSPASETQRNELLWRPPSFAYLNVWWVLGIDACVGKVALGEHTVTTRGCTTITLRSKQQH